MCVRDFFFSRLFFVFVVLQQKTNSLSLPFLLSLSSRITDILWFQKSSIVFGGVVFGGCCSNELWVCGRSFPQEVGAGTEKEKKSSEKKERKKIVSSFLLFSSLDILSFARSPPFSFVF